jgi:hypothetical protein
MNTLQYPVAFTSTVMGLGAPRQFFPVKKMNRLGNLIAFILLLVGSLLVFLYGLYGAYAAYQKHGLVMFEEELIVPATLALGMLVLGLVAGGAAYRNWKKGVVVYERGFAFHDRNGIQTWNWQDVISVTAAITRHYANGIYTGTTHVYSLINRQNQRLVLSDIYTKVEELAKIIQDSIYPLLYDQAAQQYNTGQKLVFGPVVISKDGIQVGKKAYPWSEVQQVSIHQGNLKVSKKSGGWFSGTRVSASAIPNLNILLNIIHQVVGIKMG